MKRFERSNGLDTALYKIYLFFLHLRRLKTWLRSTQSQKRLHHVVVCNVHKGELDSVDSLTLMAEFAGKSPQRSSMFGSV